MRVSVRRATALLAVLAATTAAGSFGAPVAQAEPEWTAVGTGMTGGVSGAAPTASGWVLVRDNKKAGQNRVSLLSPSGLLTPLVWPGVQPVDLEAVAASPVTPGRFVAMTSSGSGWVIEIVGQSITVIRPVALPVGTRNVESFALTSSGAGVVAVWATRGSSTSPARVYASTFEESVAGFGVVARGLVSVPYPSTAVRHVADLVVNEGRLLGSATSDPGRAGPFTSAVYDYGTVALVAGAATLALGPPQLLAQYPGHKVEALTCAGPTTLLGTDDESLGGWIASDAICT